MDTFYIIIDNKFKTYLATMTISPIFINKVTLGTLFYTCFFP